MLDEPTTGLAPIRVPDMFRSLMEINRTTGTVLTPAERNAVFSLRQIERAIVLKTGGIIFDGPSAEPDRQEDMGWWF